MNELTKLIKQVDDLEYRIDNIAKQNVDILRKIINSFEGDITETFDCAIRHGKIDVEVFTGGASSISFSLDGVIISSSAGGFLTAHAEGISLGLHTLCFAISQIGHSGGAMIVCYGAI